MGRSFFSLLDDLESALVMHSGIVAKYGTKW
jgi:hypothetical protein